MKRVRRQTDWSDLPFPRIGDEPWQREAVQWVLEGFGRSPKAGLCEMIRSSPQAVDYLKQAPIIGCYEPKTAARALSRGGRLKEILARLKLAYPLRKLSAQGCSEGSLDLFRALSRLHPSLVSQAIPVRKDQHREWVKELGAWRAKMDARGRSPEHQFEWAVVQAGPAVAARLSLRDVADLAAARGEAFNPLWSYDRALKAAVEWHVELTKTRAAERLYREMGVGFEEPIDYGDLPVEQHVAGLDIVALRSGADLHADGRMMRHCVASYGRDVAKGRCRIYSIRKGVTPLATMELKPAKGGWSLAQIKGPCNVRPDETVLNAAHLFLASLADAERLARPGRTGRRASEARP